MVQKMVIVGFGGQGKLIFNAATKRLADELIVIAICDMNPAAFEAKPGQESWQTVYRPGGGVNSSQASRVYRDYQEMLDKETPDIVAVATWTKEHAAVVEAAAINGVKKILCEMPLASSLRQARRMIDACRNNGVLLAVNHTRRWLPDHQEVRRRRKQ